jgi:hypothetical protein
MISVFSTVARRWRTGVGLSVVFCPAALRFAESRPELMDERQVIAL